MMKNLVAMVPRQHPGTRLKILFGLSLLLCGSCSAPAQTVLGAWEPVFKGVDHAAGTNTPGGGGFSTLQVAHLLRVDLTDPDVQLFTSPRITNYVAGSRETAGYTTTNALRLYNLQAIINANAFYSETGSTSYDLPEGTGFNVGGLLISQGEVISMQDSAKDCASILFSTNNAATFIPTNWPAHDTAGAFTAVSGLYAILVDGVNVGSNYLGAGGGLHGREPRAAVGLSKDRRYLYLLVVDGRQPGYSYGAYDWETAAWLMQAGAWDGSNMDGGGSASLVIMDSTGRPLPLNRDSASAAIHRQRTVGCHLGIYAKPLPGFFSDIIVTPQDTSALIEWTTSEAATTQVRYGLTTNLESSSPLITGTSLAHSVVLTNLTPATEYFFALLGTTASNTYTSPTFSVVTTNYVVTNVVFTLTNEWKFTTDNLDGINWTSPAYDDSGWQGSGPGLLWVDSRGPNQEILQPLNTEMPLDPATDYPHRTYYLRTHFTFTNSAPAAGLVFDMYLDDGAVFFLNGTELYRVQMPSAPEVISNDTLAISYGCGGDATCPQSFYISGPLAGTNLVAGDNTLAVEVHNYSARSPDITFGLALSSVLPIPPPTPPQPPALALAYMEGVLTLTWSGTGFTLQEAESPFGRWSDVPGPVTTSPYVIPETSSTRFLRLRK